MDEAGHVTDIIQKQITEAEMGHLQIRRVLVRSPKLSLNYGKQDFIASQDQELKGNSCSMIKVLHTSPIPNKV